MSSPEVIYACRLLIRDTFRQALANRIFWVMLGACAVVDLVLPEHHHRRRRFPQSPDPRDIGIAQPGVDRPKGHIYFAFGAWRLEMGRDGQDMVHFILLALGEYMFGIVGTLFALLVTAGFVPEFLQESNATVLLSKPTPRWVLLLGKYLGVLSLLAVYVGVYVIGTWLALGLRTGYWVDSYLWGMPLLLIQVAAIYSFSVFLGVCTRSTLVSVFGSVLFWLICWSMNYGHHMVVALGSELPEQHVVLRGLVEAGYWILPKPFDLNMILHAAVESGQAVPQMQPLQQLGTAHPELSILTSLAFVVAMVLLSAQQLANKDY